MNRSSNRRPGSPVAQSVQLGLHPSYRQKGPSITGPVHGAGIHRRVFDHHSPSLSDTLPPFPMWPALLASEYYDGSAPVRGLQQATRLSPEGSGRGRFPCSLLFGRRVRHPALPLRPRRGYAVDLHHDLPGPAHPTDPTVPHRPGCMACSPDRQVRTALQPRSAGFELVDDEEALQHRFLTYAFPSCSPDPAHPVVLDRPDFVAAAPTLPGVPRLRLPPASPHRYDGKATKVSHPHPKQQRLTAHGVLIQPDKRTIPFH